MPQFEGVAGDEGTSMTSQRARLTFRALAGAVATAAMLLGGAIPAAAAAPAYFTEVTGSRLRVDGNFLPLVGHFSGLTYDDVVWFSRSAPDRIWSGGHHGTTPDDVFTKPQLNVDMGDGFDAVVGDFSGDRRDDIYWVRQSAPGSDVLWTTTAAHTFTATPVPHLPGVLTVHLPDSDTGTSKDDLVRFGTNWSGGTLWVFPEAGSGAPTATAIPPHPNSGPFMAGEFDGNGAADLLSTGAGPTPAKVWSRASGTATTFTTRTVGPGNGGLGIVGRFGKAIDERRDIIFPGSGQASSQNTFIPARAVLWESKADGTFARSTIDLGTTSAYLTPVQGTSRDLLLMAHVSVKPIYAPSPKPPIAGDTVWYQTTAGPVTRATGNRNLLSGGLALALPGRFASSTRQDVFAYAPGTATDWLLKIR